MVFLLRMQPNALSRLSLTWLPSAFTERPNWQYDFSKCLDGLPPFENRPKAFAQAGKILSCCELLPEYLLASSIAQEAGDN